MTPTFPLMQLSQQFGQRFGSITVSASSRIALNITMAPCWRCRKVLLQQPCKTALGEAWFAREEVSPVIKTAQSLQRKKKKEKKLTAASLFMLADR